MSGIQEDQTLSIILWMSVTAYANKHCFNGPTGQNLTGTLSVFCFLLVGPQGIYLHASIRLNFNMKGFSFAILGAFCGLLTGIIVKNKGEMPQSCSLFLL
jgi:hypothetical protein